MDDHPNDTPTEPVDEDAPARFARLRQRATDLSERATTTVERRRRSTPIIDMAVDYYERDREALASALGAAVALRLYLLLVPAIAMLVGLAILLVGKDGLDSLLASASVTGTMAQDISDAASASSATGWAFLIGGLWLTLWAGRSLTKVLAACAGRAWRLEPKHAKARIAAIGALTAMLIVVFTCTMLLNRLRDRHGFAATTTSWLITGALFAAGWFIVCWFLPRRTPDPGALLPGAAFIGIAMACVQWFMQFYLPDKISRSTELMGDLGMSIAALGYLFLVGRLMASSFIIDAVIFDRVGSISQFVFGLPVIRRIPQRYEIVARFFDLQADGATPVEGVAPATPEPDQTSS